MSLQTSSPDTLFAAYQRMLGWDGQDGRSLVEVLADTDPAELKALDTELQRVGVSQYLRSLPPDTSDVIGADDAAEVRATKRLDSLLRYERAADRMADDDETLFFASATPAEGLRYARAMLDRAGLPEKAWEPGDEPEQDSSVTEVKSAPMHELMRDLVQLKRVASLPEGHPGRGGLVPIVDRLIRQIDPGVAQGDSRSALDWDAAPIKEAPQRLRSSSSGD